ncbi:hypothetical protein Q3G72_010332 [Acer saccharum]|nr:hypothetical protein Q3G72_010332 [Acer saccharum]
MLQACKERSALRCVIQCIEEYKLEAEFSPENLKKPLQKLEKAEVEKKKPAAVPANKRQCWSNASNQGWSLNKCIRVIFSCTSYICQVSFTLAIPFWCLTLPIPAQIPLEPHQSEPPFFLHRSLLRHRDLGSTHDHHGV